MSHVGSEKSLHPLDFRLVFLVCQELVITYSLIGFGDPLKWTMLTLPSCCVCETFGLFAYRQSKEKNLRTWMLQGEHHYTFGLYFVLCSCLIISPLIHIKISQFSSFSQIQCINHTWKSLYRYDWYNQFT